METDSGITRRRQVEERLQATEERYRNLIESIPEVIFSLSVPDGVIRSLTPPFERKTGWPREEWLGKPYQDLLHSDDAGPAAQHFQRALRGEWVPRIEARFRCRSGEWLVGEIMLWPEFRQGTVAAVNGCVRDVTQRKQTELRAAAFAALGQRLSSAATYKEAARILSEITDGLFGWESCTFALCFPDREKVRAVLELDRIEGRLREIPLPAAETDPAPEARQIMQTGTGTLGMPGDGELPGPVSQATVPAGVTRPAAPILMVPVRNGAKVIGLLSIRSGPSTAYTPGDLETLQALADSCGGALERIRAQEALRKSEESYRMLFDGVPVGLYRCSPGGAFLDINRAVVDIWGYPNRTTFLAAGTRELFVHPEEQERWLQIVSRVVFVRDCEMQIRRRDGSVIWIRDNARSVRAESGAILYYEGAIEDITERKRAEEALRSAEANYRSIFENASEGIFQSTPQGRYLSANPALAAMLGYESPEDLIASVRSIGDQLCVRPETRDELQRRLETEGSVRGFENQLYRKDGSTLWVSVNARVVRDSEGRVRYYEGSNEDITERKRAETRLKASLREKELLLKEIHHRVKNNLQVVSSLLHLHAGTITDPAVLERFRASQYRLKTMAVIHEKLYQSPDLSRINFAEYARNLMNYLFHSFGLAEDRIGLEVRIDEVFLGINSAIPCGLILNELASNSLKHAFPGGRPGQIRIEVEAKHDQFHFRYRDDGVGPPEGMDVRQGRSLGLQLIQMLTDQLNGSLEWRGPPGLEFQMVFTEPRTKER